MSVVHQQQNNPDKSATHYQKQAATHKYYTKCTKSRLIRDANLLAAQFDKTSKHC